jgi:carbamate kinase
VYTRRQAEELARMRGWSVAPDGDGWRRVVPSPQPQDLVELSTIRLLLDAGVLVICTGGGGIPVVRDAGGALRGVEAVIDKDLAAALLASELRADALLILTDVEHVMRDHGTAQARPIHRATVAQLRGMDFAAGSMAPKVEAACRFVEAGGGFAAIGSLAQAAAMLGQNAGTIVTRTAVDAGVGVAAAAR